MKGEIAVRYTIRHFDLPLFTFEANMDSADTGLHIIKVYEENRSFLPLNLTVSEDGVERWLRHRAIPKNRAYVDALLSKVGLSLNRPLGIIAANKGLSLNDCFWVDAEGSGDTFEKVNLYDNRFSQVLAAIAFTGYGSSIRTSLASCPEFSTNGMLPKCWRRQNGKIYLYKGGTSGFSNLGFEPYSELYAYQVAQVMGVNAIRYTLTKDLKKTLCSKCELFTSKEYSYIPIGQLVSKGGIKAIFAYKGIPQFAKHRIVSFAATDCILPQDVVSLAERIASIYAKNGYITAYGIHADRFNVHIHFAVCAVSFQTQNMFHIQWESEWNMLVTVTNQWKSEFDEMLQNNIQMRQSREAALYGDDIVRYGSISLTAKGQMNQNKKSKRK